VEVGKRLEERLEYLLHARCVPTTWPWLTVVERVQRRGGLRVAPVECLRREACG
jgi:hypothetical protein